ncbi:MULTISPECIES: TusE/DsrC/DsvC family sulfur relay protein [Ornithinimicrobium]|uniref:TusE/DsrC/DsvC family sulfur relay protein n=1 Tax=Ornithinimicrobium kibberense TaxID=282060 RepID=A0ABV5V6W9_9MICO|nr:MULTISPECIES: TusE/DsrC/DsvC family sulfur relay protein [Ornithinimicrobium]OLT22223.1 sulfur relay protein DsrC [Ornithinimicrobium sp. CNJ-824]
MPTNTLNDRTFEVDAEGFLTRRDDWSEDLAADMAALIGIDLSDEHLAILRFMREDSAQTGVTPTLRRIQTVGGFDIKTLFALYPGKPAKKMAWLSGLPKPVGCV